MTPLSEASGGLKENSQNYDSESQKEGAGSGAMAK